MIIPKNNFHFSIDDVFDAFIEVSDKGLKPEEHYFFDFLQKLHKDFNVNIDLYLFYQKEINGKKRTLREISSDFKEWFAKNNWLRLGPHALEFQLSPYQQTIDEQIKTFDNIYKEIKRFSGNFSKLLRLHYFSESFELAKYFHKKGVEAIFTTDKAAATYRMSNKVKDELIKRGYSSFRGLTFIRTHLRVENLVNEKLKIDDIKKIIEQYLNRYGFLILFTHEYELKKEDVKQTTNFSLRILNKKGIKTI